MLEELLSIGGTKNSPALVAGLREAFRAGSSLKQSFLLRPFQGLGFLRDV